MRSLHIIAGLDQKDGGPSYSVPRLCHALRVDGCTASILTVQGSETIADPHIESFVQQGAGVPLLRALRLSGDLYSAALEAAKAADVVHVHGLWLMPNIYAGAAAARAGKPLIVSPRGMLAPVALNFSRWTKRAFWSLLQGPAYAKAAAWHATSEEEASDIRAFGIEAPIAVIPNGVDLFPVSEERETGKSRRTLLFLSRIHPKKGLPSLVSAWAKVSPDHLDWDLVIAGPNEGRHREQLETQALQQGAGRIHFPGPVFGVEKQALLRTADVFVLPTKNENFGLVVAEALAAGVPAIVTKGAPWSGLEREGCGWWVDGDPDSSVGALRQALSCPRETLRSMGANGRAWVAREFSWSVAAEKMVSLYAWIAGSAEMPGWVRLV